MWCVAPVSMIQGMKFLPKGKDMEFTLPAEEITEFVLESRGVEL
jgi:hypothetical protein